MEYNRANFEKLWREYEDEFWKETNKNLNNFLNYITNVNKDKNCKPNNNAPKSIKGDYDLSIHGNKIVLVDNKDGTTVEAKCHPDDGFDIGVGINEAFKKLNQKREEDNKQKKEEEKKIKVGDWVEVTWPGESYTTLSNYFNDNGILSYAPYYRYGVTPCIGIKGKVVFVDSSHVVFQVEEDKKYGDKRYDGLKVYDSVYIVKQEGLKKVTKPNV